MIKLENKMLCNKSLEERESRLKQFKKGADERKKKLNKEAT